MHHEMHAPCDGGLTGGDVHGAFINGCYVRWMFWQTSFTRSVRPPATRRIPQSAMLVLLAMSGWGGACDATIAAAQGATAARATVPPSDSRTASFAASLTLERTLELARENGPSVRIADARRDAAFGRARESAQFTNPTIEYRRENLGSTLPPDIFATVYLPFDVTGRRLAQRRAAGEARARIQSEGVTARRDAEVHVARLWLDAASAQEHLQVVQAQAGALEEVATVDATRQREGVVSEGAAMRTRLEADRARVSLATALGLQARARAELSRALGVAETQLGALPSLPVPLLPPPPDGAEAIALAMASRPDVAARAAGVREAQARASAEQRGALGDWQLQGGSKKTAGVMTGQVGLALPFPLFNRNDGARLRTRAELAEATAWKDDLTIGVAADAVAAITMYSALRAQAAEVSTFAQRGREIAASARVAYREGHASLVELLDAERAATDATQAHIRWTADAWLSRFELERALGVRLDADSPLDLPLRAALPPSTK